MDAINSRLEELYGGEHNAADERLTELRREVRAKREAGDEAGVKTAKDAIAKVMEEGGPDLANYLEETSRLRQRRQTVSMNTAGLAERADRIMEKLADLEEDNIRTMQRLIRRGQLSQGELARLDPKRLADRVSSLRDSFASLASKADAAADRAKAGIETLRASSQRAIDRADKEAQTASANAQYGDPEKAAEAKRVAKAARDKAGAVRAERDAKVEARLAKEEASQRERAKRMNRIAHNLEFAEGFDREGAIEQINQANERLKAEASGASLERGERAGRMQERLAALDPKRVEDRLKTIEAMKKDQARSFYDRWEIDKQGTNLDVNNPNAADFSEAARDIAESVFRKRMGIDNEGSNGQFVTVNERGPMKARTDTIPDAKIEDFLENNIEELIERHTRTMGADIELTRSFGRPDMRDQIREVDEDYNRLIAKATTEKERLALDKQRAKDKEQLAFRRDSLRGTLSAPFWERDVGRVFNVARDMIYLTRMGGVTLSSLPDAARPIMVHGIGQYMTTIPRLAYDLKNIRLGGIEARLSAVGTDAIKDHRMASLTETMDPHSQRSPMEAFMKNMVHIENTFNGIRMWTDKMKMLAGTMTQHRVLRNIGKGMDNLKPREQAYMNYLGIDKAMAERIAKQHELYGENEKGLNVAHTMRWQDAEAVRALRYATNKDVDSIIIQPGQSDIPYIAKTALGQIMLQFQSFTLASQQRVLYRGLQEGPSRFVGGMVALTSFGMLSAYLKAVAADAGTGRNTRTQELFDNPGTWIGKGLDVGGILATLMWAGNTFEQFTGLNPVTDPIHKGAQRLGFDKPDKPSGGIKADPTKLISGPAGGLFSDIGKFAGGTYEHFAHNKPMSYAAKNAGRHLIPGNNLPLIQQMMNHLVGPPPVH